MNEVAKNIFIGDILLGDKRNQKWTPENYLECKNVIVAHLGIQEYHRSEFANGVFDTEKVSVKRTEDDLFDEEVMQSLKGKPITDGHPKETVNANNIKKYQIGQVVNVWREDDKLMADIMITNKRVADEIWNGEKTRVSLGYIADVIKDVDDEGYYKFDTKFINHLAIVERGRAKNAYIPDGFNENAKGKGGESEVENKNPNTESEKVLDNNINDEVDVNDAVYKTTIEEHTKVEETDDYEKDAYEVITQTTTKRFRRKVEDDNNQNIEVIVGDDDKGTKVSNNKNKTEKGVELDMNIEELRGLVLDAVSTSIAKVKDELKEELTKEIKQTEVIVDNDDENFEVKPKNIVNDEEVINDGLSRPKDVELDHHLEEFYASLNSFDKIYHQTVNDGEAHLDKVKITNPKVLLRELRKVGKL